MALSLTSRENCVHMSYEENTRTVWGLAYMCCHEVIDMLLLIVNLGRETEIMEALLEIFGDTIDTCFGKGAGVDVYNRLQIRQKVIHDLFGTYYSLVFLHLIGFLCILQNCLTKQVSRFPPHLRAHLSPSTSIA